MRCDVLALGVVEAAKEMKIDIPLVVRLAGTNYEKGKKILDDSKLKIISASDLSEAAKKVRKGVEGCGHHGAHAHTSHLHHMGR